MKRRNTNGGRGMYLVLLLWTILEGATMAAEECTGTRLVVLAGPRRSATTSVAEFFYKWARGVQPGHSHGKQYHPLGNFRWPLVYGPVSNETETERPYKRYNHLVLDPYNEPLRQEIIEAIKRDYENPSVQAVIFGGEEFDQVGEFSLSGDHAIQAVRDIQEAVNAPSECVTILLNYRVPRFEHWVSLYSSLSLLESGEEESGNTFVPYEEHMCMDESSYLRMSELGTSMNPMYLAEIYLKADPGWKVDMIDMGGVAEDETDISHTIGCDILGGKCDDEKRWVKGHIEETITNKVIEKDYNNLPEMEIEDSEMIFRYRDCAYEQEFAYEDRFNIVRQYGIWDTCNHEDEQLEKIYQSLRSSDGGNDLVFEALLSQVDCSPYGSGAFTDVPLNIQQILNGEHLNKNTLEKLGLEDGKHSMPMIVMVVVLVGSVSAFLFKKRQGGSGGYQKTRIELNDVGKSRPKPTTYRDQMLSQVPRNTIDDDESSDDDSSDDEDDDNGRTRDSFRDEII